MWHIRTCRRHQHAMCTIARHWSEGPHWATSETLGCHAICTFISTAQNYTAPDWPWCSQTSWAVCVQNWGYHIHRHIAGLSGRFLLPLTSK